MRCIQKIIMYSDCLAGWLLVFALRHSEPSVGTTWKCLSQGFLLTTSFSFPYNDYTVCIHKMHNIRWASTGVNETKRKWSTELTYIHSGYSYYFTTTSTTTATTYSKPAPGCLQYATVSDSYSSYRTYKDIHKHTRTVLLQTTCRT